MAEQQRREVVPEVKVTQEEFPVFQKASVTKVSEKHVSNRPINMEGGYAVIDHPDEEEDNQYGKKRTGSVETEEDEPPIRYSNESVVNEGYSLSTSN